MDKLVYLFLGLLTLLPVIVIYLRRADLRKNIIKTGLAGGVAGLIAELFYFQDYWQPVGLLGITRTYPEDFIFGFAITSLSATLYAFLSRQQFTDSATARPKLFLGLFFGLGLAGMFAFDILLEGNSTIVSSALFVVIGIIMILIRRDITVPALLTSALLTVYFLMVYIILFYWLSPNWWQQYWLLNGTPYDIKILGSIPVTELLWYACWTFLGAVCLPFLTGQAFRKH